MQCKKCQQEMIPINGFLKCVICGLMINNELKENGNNKVVKDEKGRFVKGYVTNPNGRPKGSVSPITKLRQMWEEHPEDFERFVLDYRKNQSNQKHIVEMLDGSPQKKIEVSQIEGMNSETNNIYDED